MKKQSDYSRMKESVGMHDYMKGKKAGMEIAGMEKYMKHKVGGDMSKYPMHSEEIIEAEMS